MSTKTDLLYELTVKKLQELDKENGVSLVAESWLGEYTATTKDETIEKREN